VAWFSVFKTAGTEFAARSRITSTTQRLPYWFPANDGRDGLLLVLRRPAPVENPSSNEHAPRVQRRDSHRSSSATMMGFAGRSIELTRY